MKNLEKRFTKLVAIAIVYSSCQLKMPRLPSHLFALCHVRFGSETTVTIQEENAKHWVL